MANTDVLHQLNALGWEWRENGVVICVVIDGQKLSVFVPLQKVWDIFNRHMTSVGCPLQLGVGAPFTVGGFFGSIVHAVSSVAKTVTKPVAVVAKAATQVANVAKNYGAAALSSVTKIPIIGPLAKSTAQLMTAPIGMVNAIANGQRIDRAALSTLKNSLASVKQIAPYAQTVLSFVPGVGQGLSGALGASLALASGQSINDAILAGVRGAIPGGPLVQAAFDFSSNALQGKPIIASALNALPLSPQAKQALIGGLAAAQRMANGQNVSAVVLDTALHQLPPAYQKAIQIGTAIGHAKSLQDAAGKAVSAAAQLASNYKAGALAQSALRALPAGVPHPPSLIHAVQQATAARNTMANVVSAAQRGNTVANQIVNAMKLPLPPSQGTLIVGMPAQFVPIYIGAPLAHHHHNPRARRSQLVRVHARYLAA